VNFSVGVAFHFQLRGAGIEVVWKPFLILLVIGSMLFCLALARFRKTISQMA
jgi:ABC-2 type transport system permease protein